MRLQKSWRDAEDPYSGPRPERPRTTRTISLSPQGTNRHQRLYRDHTQRSVHERTGAQKSERLVSLRMQNEEAWHGYTKRGVALDALNGASRRLTNSDTVWFERRDGRFWRASRGEAWVGSKLSLWWDSLRACLVKLIHWDEEGRFLCEREKTHKDDFLSWPTEW